MTTRPTGDDLRRWRDLQGLTQHELARLLDVSFATVNRWENGRVDISPENLGKVRALLAGEPLNRRRSLFLSHSSRDRAFCERLALDLTNADIPVWYDEWELKVGDSLRAKISEGIESQDYLAVVLSHASIASSWVHQELNAALDRELKEKKVVVLPLLIQDCEAPTFLRDKKFADFREDYGAGLEQLLRALDVDPSDVRVPVAPHRVGALRNDELALQPTDFEDWLIDLLEEEKEIRVQRVLRNWRETARALNPSPASDETLDIDESGVAFLLRLAIAGNVFLRFNRRDLWDRVANLLFDCYLTINQWGLEVRSSVDFNTKPARARCRVLDSVFALGAAAVDEGKFDWMMPLLDRHTPDDGYWAKRGWFRYTLTMAARSDQSERSTWYLPIERAAVLIDSTPTLSRDFLNQDAALTSLCQFDLIQCLYWTLQSQDAFDRSRDSYPTCALYPARHVEPLLLDLIRHGRASSSLPQYSNEDLAQLVHSFANTVKARTFYGGYGWNESGWAEPAIREFLKEHGQQI